MKKNFLVVMVCILINLSGVIARIDNCTSAGCHQKMISTKIIHPPIEDDCLSCHESESQNHPGSAGSEFILTSQAPELCYDCHDQKNQLKNIHSPVEEGDCILCHNPHSSENEFMLRKVNSAICMECHEIEESDPYLHGPLAAKMCSACHDPHQSDYNALLKEEPPELCFFCHSNKLKENEMASVHPPYEDDCLECHTPHTAAAKYLLKTDVPQLCYSCHETVEVALNRKSEVHGPFQEGNKCYRCHDAHASDNEPLLNDKEKNLCFTCHNRQIQLESRTLKNIQKQIIQSTHIHSPIEDEGCSPCHNAHTPDNFFLLSGAFPVGNYSEGKKENFAHCFDCHDSSLMGLEKTTEATQFRDGNRNLHYLHVNREKARNCTTCHSIHGSQNPFLIAETIRFGQWNMPIKFKVIEGGGSCLAGCHKELSYNRNIKNH